MSPKKSAPGSGSPPAARCPRPPPPTSPCSTSPTTRPASCTSRSTPPSPRSGRPRPARTSIIKQSHGGSGKQARSIIDGLEADVVTLALAYDIDAAPREGRAHPQGLAEAPAQQQLALHLDHRVRGAQGQPQGDQGLGRPGQARRQGDHPQPQDLGRRALELPGGLGLGAASKFDGDEAKVKDFVGKLFKNVPVLDSGARGSTTTFAQRGIGDVFLSWENEAFLVLKEFGKDKFEIVAPVGQHPGRAAGDRGRQERQQTRHHQGGRGLPASSSTATRGRRSSPGTSTARATPAVAARSTPAVFPKITLFTIDEVFGGWQKAQKTHFEDNGHLRPDLPGRQVDRARRRQPPDVQRRPRRRPPDAPSRGGAGGRACCRASRPRWASPSLYLSLIVLIPLAGDDPADRRAELGASSGPPSPRRGRWPPTS